MARMVWRPVAVASLLAFTAFTIASQPRLTFAAGPDQEPQGKAAPSKKKSHGPKKNQKELAGKDARLAFIRQAQVWAPTNVAEMDLRAGPQGPDAFQPNEMVTCDYVATKLPGTTQKFDCAISKADVV